MRAARDHQGWLELAPASHVEPGPDGPGLVAVRAVAGVCMAIRLRTRCFHGPRRRRRPRAEKAGGTSGVPCYGAASGSVVVHGHRWRHKQAAHATWCCIVPCSPRMPARISTVSAAQRRSAQPPGSCRWVAGSPGRSLPHGHESPSPCIVRFRNGRPSKKRGRTRRFRMINSRNGTGRPALLSASSARPC